MAIKAMFEKTQDEKLDVFTLFWLLFGIDEVHEGLCWLAPPSGHAWTRQEIKHIKYQKQHQRCYIEKKKELNEKYVFEAV